MNFATVSPPGNAPTHEAYDGRLAGRILGFFGRPRRPVARRNLSGTLLLLPLAEVGPQRLSLPFPPAVGG